MVQAIDLDNLTSELYAFGNDEVLQKISIKLEDDDEFYKVFDWRSYKKVAEDIENVKITEVKRKKI